MDEEAGFSLSGLLLQTKQWGSAPAAASCFTDKSDLKFVRRNPWTHMEKLFIYYSQFSTEWGQHITGSDMKHSDYGTIGHLGTIRHRKNWVFTLRDKCFAYV